MIRLSRARLAQLITALAVLVGALTLSSGSAQAAAVNGAFTNVVVTAASGSGPINPWEQVRVSADWAVPDYTPAGSTFSLAWPTDKLAGVGGDVQLKDDSGDVIAECVLGTGSLDCTLTSYVTTHPFDINGTVFVTLTQVSIPEHSTVSIPFTAGTTNETVLYQTSGSVPQSFDGLSFYKDVAVEDGKVTWYIYLPGGKTGQEADYANVVIEDTLGAPQTLVPNTISLENATSLNAEGTWPLWQTAAASLFSVDTLSTTSFRLTAPLLSKGGWWRVKFEVNVPEGYTGQVSNTSKASWDAQSQVTTSHTEIYLAVGGTGSAEFRAVSVGDYVWWDTNHNGIQDDGPNHGIAGAVLTLTGPDGKPVTDALGKPVGPTTTDATGMYLFNNLPVLNPGEHYTVTVTAPAGYTPTKAGAGSDRALDSSTGSAVSSELTKNGDEDLSLDFGFVKGSVSVGDYVWSDTNRDGLQTAGEPGVPGVKVNLLLDGVVVATATTDKNGYYGFGDLEPGISYSIQFVVPSGQTVTTQNAGGDTTNSATTDLTDSDADAAGLVTFTAPTSGSNSVEPTKADNPGIDLGLVPSINLTLNKTIETKGPVRNGAELTYTLTPHNDGPANALAGWSVTDVLPASMTLVSISGGGYTCDSTTDATKPVCVAAAGLAAGADGSAITVVTKVTVDYGSLKNVAFVSPAPGEVPETNPLVVPGLTTDTSTTPTDNDAQAVINVASPVSVGDYVWWDTNRDGLQSSGEKSVPGVTVTLKDADGNVVASTVTDENGYYSFADLVPGARYDVIFTAPSGTSFTTQNAGTDDALDSDAPASGKVSFVAPLTGTNETAPGKADLPTLDAGLLEFNLSLTKKATTTTTIVAGSTVTYEVVPHNDGPVDALPGWSVTEVLPEGSTLKALSGSGYTCTMDKVCVSSEALAAGADGKPITVQILVPAGFVGSLKNVAYVSPSDKDVPETNPLVVPTITTDTKTSPTDNDAEAIVEVAPDLPEDLTIANTGATISLGVLLGALGLLALGGALIGAGRLGARSRRD